MSEQPKFVLREFDPIEGADAQPVIIDYVVRKKWDRTKTGGCIEIKSKNVIHGYSLYLCFQLYIEEECWCCDDNGRIKTETSTIVMCSNDCDKGRIYKLYNGDNHKKIVQAMEFMESARDREEVKANSDADYINYAGASKFLDNELEKAT